MPPRVSIVIPVRNRPDEIRSCIRSLSGLDYPRDRIEVIVVDDASTDETPQAAASAPFVRVLAQDSHRGQSECRNIGARAATGDIVAFIDSDCEADPGWVRILVGELEAAGAIASGGSVRARGSGTWIERFESAYSPLDLGDTAARVVPGSRVDFLPSCNLAVRRDTLLQVGAFDATLRYGEDVDLVWRLCERGEVRYRPQAIVWHRPRARLRAFLSTRRRYAAAQAVFLKRHPRNRRRLDLPAGLVLFAVAAAAGFAWPGAWLIGASIPFAEAAFNAAFAGPAAATKAVRAYASAVYRVVSLVAGVYAAPIVIGSLVAVPFWPAAAWIAAGIAGCILLSGIVEWVRLRPPIDPARFLVAFVLDRATTSVGILTGCLAHRTLQPLSLKVRLHPSAAGMPGRREESEPVRGDRP